MPEVKGDKKKTTFRAALSHLFIENPDLPQRNLDVSGASPTNQTDEPHQTFGMVHLGERLITTPDSLLTSNGSASSFPT